MTVQTAEYTTRRAAQAHLKALGMAYSYKSSFSDQDREYWAYGDGTDRLLDHTATITKIGRIFYISDFGRRVAEQA